MASTKLYKQQVNASNRKKFTISLWFKRSGLTGSSGNGQYLFESYLDSSNRIRVELNSNEELKIIQNQSGSTNFKLSSTSMKFRDTSGWYHLVIAVDTTLSTASDRGKMYINGTRITSFSSTTDFPLDNTPSQGNSGYGVYIGGYGGGSSNFYDGLISHYNFVDGTAYDPSYFGETDATTGEWKIKTSPSVTYGANGFFILKDGNSVTDQSGNSNNFAVSSGTLTKTEDNPSNIFASINNVLGTDVVGSTCTFSNGNTVAEDPNGSASGINPNFISTLGMPSKGKWYCELQPSSFSTSSGHSIGIYRTKGSTDDTGEGDLEGSAAKIRYIFADTAIYIIKYGTNDQTGLTAITSGQTVGMALDLDNGTLQYYVNGSTRANVITGINSANDGFDYFFHAGLESSSSGRYGKYSWNFGNGAFGSTQLTGTTYQDSQGRGIFKHQPPTNFLALCTRNLNV